MTRFVPRWLLAAGLGGAMLALPVAPAADKESPSGADKPADWSKFVVVGDVFGEVVKADASGITLRITYYAPRGGSTSRPSIRGGSGRSNRGAQMTPHHHDYVLPYAEGGMARQTKLPPKPDVDGKKVEYTPKELEEAVKPAGMPKYAADKSAVKVGSHVEVMLVRSKDIPAAKATDADVQIKYVLIPAPDPTKPATTTTPATPAKK